MGIATIVGIISLLSSATFFDSGALFTPYELLDDDLNYDQNQFVFSDMCRDKEATFCHSKVENSICNAEKNECFCKKGFVVIKEVKKTICKPLLTDLACRVDGDCVHVGGSMCHPGAGQCVCPRRHVFVPQIFLCRRKYDSLASDNRLCKMCRDNGGECFRYDFKDPRIFGSEETVGCSCGGNRALVSNESPTALNICAAKLVDIGQPCNNRDLLCRSTKATCVNVYQMTYKCHCNENHVAVFQSNLRYHECFSTIDLSSSPRKCAKCHQAGGHCYDSTSTNQPDGCACPSSFSNVDSGSTSLTNPCTIKHLFTTCMEDKIKLCFLPFTAAPYESLKTQLRVSRASVFIRYPETVTFFDSGSPIRRTKLIVQSQNMNDMLFYCGFVNMNEKDVPLKVRQIQNKIEYEGLFEIVREPIKQSMTTDISLPFKCEKEGTLSGTSDPGYPESLQLELRVLDSKKNTEITNVNRNVPVLLDVTLIDSKGLYTDMFISNCFISNRSVEAFTIQYAESIFQSCHNSSSKKHVSWKQIFPGIHYQTGPLQFSQVTAWQGEIFVQCQISLCRSQQACHRGECRGTAEESYQTKFFYRSIKVVLLEKNKESLENMMGVSDDICPYSLCLNQLQAVMTSILLLLLLFLVVILLTILFKRQKNLQIYANSKKSVASNLTSYKASNDFVHGNNQNFYLLTDNNSISNSTDNFEGSETAIPLRDNSGVSSFTFRSESDIGPGPQLHVPRYRRSLQHGDNNVLLASFQTVPCTRVKTNEPKAENRSYVSNDNLVKINNIDLNNQNNKSNKKIVNSVSKCNEMICMCSE